MSSKLESDVCSVYGWRHLVNVTEVTAGLAKSNGSLRPGDYCVGHGDHAAIA